MEIKPKIFSNPIVVRSEVKPQKNYQAYRQNLRYDFEPFLKQ